MAAMSDFERHANDVWTAISAAEYRVIQFGNKGAQPDLVKSAVLGMYVTWLVACEEERLSKLFRTAVFGDLEQLPRPVSAQAANTYPSGSTLSGRAKALWGVRVAFTHGNGDTAVLQDPQNKAFALDAHHHLPGVRLDGMRLDQLGGSGDPVLMLGVACLGRST